MIVKGGVTDVTTYFALRLAADGTAATGLTITDLDLQYVRSGAAPAAKVDATALAATNSAHGDNQAIEIDATDQPGLYRVDWPDAAFAAGVREVVLTVKHTTCFIEHLRVEIDPFGAPAGASLAADIAAVKTQTAAIETDTQDIQSRLPAALVSGRMDSNTQAMASDVITAAVIATGAIDADAIADNAIDAGAIASDALTAAKFAADCITAAKIADGAIDANTFAGGAITAAAIASDAITAAKVADGTITAAKIASDAITSAKIADNAITAAKIASGAVTSSTFAAGAINAAAIADGAIDRATFAVDTGLRTLFSGTTDGGFGSTINLTGASATDDYYNGCLVHLTGGTGAGQVRLIVDYLGSTKTADVYPAWATAPSSDTTYAVLPWGSVNVTAISLDGAAADNAERFFDGTGYAGTNNVIPTVTTLTNLPAITADWLTGAGVAASAVTKIQNGLQATFTVATGVTFPTNFGSLSISVGGLVKVQSGVTKNAALANFAFLMVSSSDHVTGATGLTVTAQRSLDGAAFANCANAVTEVGNGVYKISLAAADTNGDTVMLKFTATGADARFIELVTTP